MGGKEKERVKQTKGEREREKGGEEDRERWLERDRTRERKRERGGTREDLRERGVFRVLYQFGHVYNTSRMSTHGKIISELDASYKFSRSITTTSSKLLLLEFL